MDSTTVFIRTLEGKFLEIIFGPESENAAGIEKITGKRKNT
jgi:hypothetical protein